MNDWRDRLHENRIAWEARQEAELQKANAEEQERKRKADLELGKQLGLALVFLGVMDENEPPPSKNMLLREGFAFRLHNGSHRRQLDGANLIVHEFVLSVAVFHPHEWDDYEFRHDLENWRYDLAGDSIPTVTLPDLWKTVKVYHNSQRSPDWLAEQAALDVALDEAEVAYQEFSQIVAEHADSRKQPDSATQATAPDGNDDGSDPEYPVFVALNIFPIEKVVARLRRLDQKGLVIQHIFNDGDNNPWAILG